MILLCYGTRPELIKMYPLTLELKRQNISYQTLFTGQHKHLIKEYCYLIDKPTYTFHIFKKGQSINQLYAKLLHSSDVLFRKHSFDWVFVQGDTTSAVALAQSAFHHKIKIAHIEAGLRTFQKYSPFPEEMNRIILSQLATIHFAPSYIAYNNLLRENIAKDTIYVVGNTIADSISNFNIQPEYTNLIVITLHRRENQGDKINSILSQIDCLAEKYPELRFIYIVHPNGKKNIAFSKKNENITVRNPLQYVDMLHVLSKAKLIITDSGGIQEEAMFLGKKCIICRDTTERPEVVHMGYGIVAKHNIIPIFQKLLNDYTIEPCTFYGTNVCSKIVNIFIMDMDNESEC